MTDEFLPKSDSDKEETSPLSTPSSIPSCTSQSPFLFVFVMHGVFETHTCEQAVDRWKDILANITGTYAAIMPEGRKTRAIETYDDEYVKAKIVNSQLVEEKKTISA